MSLIYSRVLPSSWVHWNGQRCERDGLPNLSVPIGLLEWEEAM